MVEVVPARTSPALLRRPYFPHPLALCCDYPVSKCPSASIVVTGTVRVNLFAFAYRLFHEDFSSNRRGRLLFSFHLFPISLTLTVLVTTIDALGHFETG